MIKSLHAFASSKGYRAVVRQKLARFASCMSAVARHGLPSRYVYFGDSLGDDLMCTVVLRELRLRGTRLPWMGSLYPALFEGNADVDRVVPMSYQFARLLARLGRQVSYVRYEIAPDSRPDAPRPTRHIITTMCRAAGIVGPITRRPWLHLRPDERAAGRLAREQIAMISSGLHRRFPILNKQWPVERFQRVARELSRDHCVVQLGTMEDPPLEAASIDLRGRTTLRESAAVLANSLCYVGTVGFLMHLARAAECRSVIVYGGRETPQLSGYICNENLHTPVPCSPCWFDRRCDHDRKCLTAIQPDEVLDAVQRVLARNGTPLETDSDIA